MNINNQTIDSVDLVLGDKEMNILGPHLVLTNCNVVLQVTSKCLTITDARFIQCKIVAKRQLKDFRWLSAFLQSCRFSGRFAGNDFGYRGGMYGPGAGLERCDFSEAILDGCRFIGCSLDGTNLPKWPCFTLLRPLERLPEIQSLDWPGRMMTWVRAFSFFPKDTVGVTDYAPSLSKQFGVSEVQVKQALERLPDIIL
jgi:hypothetical protein